MGRLNVSNALNLCFRFKMVNPDFVLSYKSAMEIFRFSLESSQKYSGNVNPFKLVLCCHHSWDPSRGQQAHPQDLSQKSVYRNKLMLVELAFCQTVRHVSSKTIRWMAPGPVLDFGPERGPGKGTMADLGPLIRHLVSTRLPSGGRAAFLSPLSPLYDTRPCV